MTPEQRADAAIFAAYGVHSDTDLIPRILQQHIAAAVRAHAASVAEEYRQASVHTWCVEQQRDWLREAIQRLLAEQYGAATTVGVEALAEVWRSVEEDVKKES